MKPNGNTEPQNGKRNGNFPTGVHCTHWNNTTAKGALAHPFQHKMTSVAIGPGKQIGICSHLAGEVFTRFNP